jgi:S-adenosylmethionine hydrolase
MRTWSRSLLSAELFVAAFRASGVVTLTTDFGLREPFVGLMKAVIHARAPAVKVIDLAHDSSAFDPVEAGFWLARSLAYFPAGTVHVAVVDPGVGTSRPIVIARVREQVLLAPDNGLLAPLAASTEMDSVWRLDLAALARFGIETVSATFHGRDIFAPLAAELAAGRCQPDTLGSAVAGVSRAGYEAAARSDSELTGVVVAVDRFGNLISNIDADLLETAENATVVIGSRRLALRRTYGDVASGEYLALINAFGVVEVACCQGSAQAGLGLGKGTPIRVSGGVKNGFGKAQNQSS